MSFFVSEYFNLPSGAFQGGIDTEVDGDTGYIFQDGTYGYVDTYVDADLAILGCNDALPIEEIRGTAVKYSVKYKVTVLPASDAIYPMLVYDNSVQPILGTLGDASFRMSVYNDAGTYIEQWQYFDTADQQHRWDGAAWQAAGVQSVRNLTLDTWYTIEITYHPEDNTYTFDNGTDTATTTACRINDDRWWLAGDFANTTYGQMELEYITVENITISHDFTLRNALTEEIEDVNDFDGSALILLNSLTTEVSEDLVFKYDILDYIDIDETLHLLFQIGGSSPVSITAPTVVIALDGQDITSKIETWNLRYESFTKIFSCKVRDKDFLKDKGPYVVSDTNFGDTRITVTVDGDSLGSFFWEETGEQVDFDNYGGDIFGRSITANLDIPYSAKVNTIYETAISKKDLIDDLCGDLTLSYNIIDTIIPANTYSVRDKSKIAIIKEVANSGGGVVHTDSDDTIIIEYATKQDSVKLITSSQIIQPTYNMVSPDGNDQVEVFGYTDDNLSGNWPKVRIESSKSNLLSNGVDSLILTGYINNPDGSRVDIEDFTDEEATPSTANKISVGSTIKRVEGIWVDSGGSHGALITKPYTWDGNTIITTGDMAKVQHLVSYTGGETCSFAVDQLADLSETTVLIENGKAETELRASDGGGGFISCDLAYKGIEDTLLITLDDPTIGGIAAQADPSSVDFLGESTITARVIDNHGNSAPDGTTVTFEIVEGSGSVTASAVTTTSTITEEVISTSQIKISVRSPIDTLTSVYLVVDGVPQTAKNFATGATTSGSSIELSEVLSDKVQNLVQVIYESGGTAQVTFTAASIGERNFISCLVGAEDVLVWVDVNIGSGGSTGISGGGGFTSSWLALFFSGTWTGSDMETVFYDTKNIVKKDGYGIQVDTTLNEAWSGYENIMGVTLKSASSSIYERVTLEIAAKKSDIVITLFDGTFVSGEGKVRDGTVPLGGITVYIDWRGDGGFEAADLAKYGSNKEDYELSTSREDGKFPFSKGIPNKTVPFYFKGTGIDVGGASVNYDEVITKTITIVNTDNFIGDVTNTYQPVSWDAVVKYRYVRE